MILLLECGSESQGNPALASLCPSLGSHQQVILCFSFFIYKMVAYLRSIKTHNVVSTRKTPFAPFRSLLPSKGDHSPDLS